LQSLLQNFLHFLMLADRRNLVSQVEMLVRITANLRFALLLYEELLQTTGDLLYGHFQTFVQHLNNSCLFQ